MPRLDLLPPRDQDGHLHCVIEAPRGSKVKTRWEPSLGAMVLGRPLPLGVHYPFDWGFVPSTVAPDGDPIDVLVLHEASTWPGVVIPARLIGAVAIEDRKGKDVHRNDRLIAVAKEDVQFADVHDARKLPKDVRAQIEQFFLTATEFTPKEVVSHGWLGPKAGTRLLDEAISRKR